jgi:Amt family ammonium transporter
VVGVHLVGGIIGTLLIGFFGTTSANSASKDGFFYGGGWSLLTKQAIAAGSVMLYSFLAALIIGYLVRFTVGFRAKPEVEVSGIDEAEHAESAYEFAGFPGGHVRSTAGNSVSGGTGKPTVLEGSKA